MIFLCCRTGDDVDQRIVQNLPAGKEKRREEKRREEKEGRQGRWRRRQSAGQANQRGHVTQSILKASPHLLVSTRASARTDLYLGRHSIAIAAAINLLLFGMLRHSSQRIIRQGLELYCLTGLQYTSLLGSASATEFRKRGYSSFFTKMGGEKDLNVVQNVDLTRYQGLWYEIASIPSRFQPSTGTNSRATYALQEDQTVDVLNETWVKGKRSYIRGSAWKADPASPDAKLKVKFMVPPFLPIIPVTGDYWVMKLDENYQWALVGVPSRTSLWVLCRTPEMSEEIYKELLEHAANEGYDISKLHKTEQIPGVGEGEGEDEKNTDRAGVWWVKSLFGK